LRPVNLSKTAATRCAQQRTCDRFRQAFTVERPHEALDMQTPASRDEVSPREMLTKRPPLEYPDRFEVRYVSANGGIPWNHHWGNVSHTCAGEYVGLEEIDDGIWNVYVGPLKLGRRLERHMRITDAYARLTRQRCLLPMSPDTCVTYLPDRSKPLVRQVLTPPPPA
jgi:hypothetical protein